MNWMFYVKTTETCNLNCKHCFTSGTSGPKVYWNTVKIIKWFNSFRKFNYHKNDTAHLEFHGGEPFLVPVSEMQYVYDATKGLWNNQSYGVTTNLVFKLKDEHIDFMKGPLGNRCGTSWDPNIRFANEKQFNLWKRNVATLIDEGVTVKLFISVTKDTVRIEPIELLKWVKDLGVQEMALERLTGNGNANLHPEIFPTNIEQDKWFLKMHEQSEQYGARNWFDNEFLETIYSKFNSGNTKQGTFCRDCEQKLFTLNATGTIGACPNASPEFNFGSLDDPMIDLINNPKRLNNIACEVARNPKCWECEVFKYCGGDCHQLGWQGDVCGAPKSLMKQLAQMKSEAIW